MEIQGYLKKVYNHVVLKDKVRKRLESMHFRYEEKIKLIEDILRRGRNPND